MTIEEEEELPDLPAIKEVEEVTGDINTLKAKIAETAEKITQLDVMLQNGRIEVSKLMRQIVSLGEQNNVPNEELRTMVSEIFAQKGADISSVRRAMPDELKMLTRTNKRYLEQTPELLAQQLAIEERQQQLKAETAGSGIEPLPNQIITMAPSTAPMTEVQRQKVRITELEREVAFWKDKATRVKERFPAKGILHTKDQDIPITGICDAVNERIENAEIDTEEMKKLYESKLPKISRKKG